MDTQQHTTMHVPVDTGLSLTSLTQKLIDVVEMELAATVQARHAFKKAKDELAELQAPFEQERKLLCATLCRHMLAICRSQIRHTLCTFSAFEVERWDKNKLTAMLPEIPALRQCVSHIPQSLLLLKD